MSEDSTAVSGEVKSTYPSQTARLYIDLSIYWFALSALWSGLITLVIQNLVQEMMGGRKDIYLGWITAVGALISTIVCMVVGTMSDRSRWSMGRRRPYIIIGTALAIPPLLWLGFVNSIPMLLLDFCLIQLWVNVATSPYQAMLPDMVPKDRQGIASAYMGMGTLLGQLCGFALYGWLIHRLPIVMCAISALLAVCMAYTIWRLPERSAKDNPIPAGSMFGTIKEAFRVKPREYPDFMRLIASRFMVNLGFYTCLQYLRYYVGDTLHAANPDKTTAIIMAIATLTGLAGNFPAGILSDRVSKKAVVYVSNAVTGVAVLIFALAGSVSVAIATAVIFGVGLGAFQAVDWAFATNLLPDRDKAKYMGIWHIAFTVPQVIAPLLGSVVTYSINTRYGGGLGYRAAMVLALIYFIVGTIMIRPIRERVIPGAKKR